MKTKIPKDIQAEVDKRLVEMLGSVDYKKVVTFNKEIGAIYIGKDRADDSRIANLKSEAEFLMQSDLWRLLSESVRHLAYEMMFVKSQSLNDLLAGKMLLFNLDSQQKTIDLLRSYQKKVPILPQVGMKK